MSRQDKTTAQLIESLGQLPHLRRKANPKRVAIDCSYRKAHFQHHHLHPLGGRLVCHVCHPPAEVLMTNPQQEINPHD